MDVVISKSENKNNKYKAVIDGKKTVHFDHSSYDDFTTHNDPKRRDNYIARTSKQDHSKQNVASPAWMSRFILWEKSTLKGAVESANKNIKI
jgi:hypothetical protein